ncbi:MULTISPECIES: hypothetical protein [unclassified Coleofasciculus]|uniref:hypothetical protein n=1 Tax=unclassified Coleofasciculus TaxID=2692782 RepID=UPI00188074B3|nr:MULTISPECIES: hypothetical protein [unclassified Coleofasciculus]MBE9125941.1 hypothetical protein [Coleofasciculus sp. LEGE 07081]MBE9149313.1 hypothetical protein [Coleofasciculus sp. LEGE 07092]
MTKKRLTDLLREEVEKLAEPDEENNETSGEQDLEQDTEAVEKPTMTTQSKSNARRSAPTKAELEATVTELRAALEETQHQDTTLIELKEALEEANQREASLQQQITDLQANLEQQKDSVEKLQQQLKTIEGLKAEFEQAKKAAVQLAQANERLTQEINTLTKQNKEDKTNRQIKQMQPQQQTIGRPIQKDSEKPADFAKKAWLL